MLKAIDKQLTGYNDIVLLLARLLIAALFIIAGYNAFKSLGGMTTYFGRLGIPMAGVMTPFVAAFEIVFGVLVAVGFMTRLSALALAILVVFAALIAHTNFADGNQVNHFLKCLGIIGGCLALMVTGPGAYSVDARKR
ncbi:MAG: putative oxidoreductase [Variibacter sp.]|jgi:putative oxidoreductase|nr:putative oxidoreductase [Variibacter sp.]